MNNALCTHIFDICGHVDSTSLNSNYSMKMSVGILSLGILSVGILSVGILSVVILSVGILSRPVGLKGCTQLFTPCNLSQNITK